MSLLAVLAAFDEGTEPDTATLRAAVKETVRAFADEHPGRSVELRIPPYAAVQCVAGPRHTRGTPANVVETDAVTWLLLYGARLGWQEAVSSGRVRASGERSDLRDLLPGR